MPNRRGSTAVLLTVLLALLPLLSLTAPAWADTVRPSSDGTAGLRAAVAGQNT